MRSESKKGTVHVEKAFATKLSEKNAFSHTASESTVWLGRLLYAHIVYDPDATILVSAMLPFRMHATTSYLRW